MSFKFTLALLFLVGIYCQPLQTVSLDSAHTFNAFQLTMSITPGQIVGLFSKRIVEGSSHWVEINTHNNQATF